VSARNPAKVTVKASQDSRADRCPGPSSSWYARRTALGDGARFVTRHQYPVGYQA